MLDVLKKAIRHTGDHAQVQAIVLHHVMGYSHDEIASMTGCKAGTVKSRISRGIARLRELPEVQDMFQQHVMVQQK